VHTVFGTRVAVLVGDYLFAQSSWFLANLDNLEVIKLISQVIADFANGEISQAGSLFNCDVTLQEYLDKSFYKTASLIAASLRSEAVFSGADEALKADMFAFGRHLGLAFQVVDDILDFTASTETLGKMAGQDLASGNLTAPTIMALTSPAGGARLRELIDSEFMDPGALDEALALVRDTGGLRDASQLARREGDAALAALHRLPPGEARRSLEAMVAWVLERSS
jgi:all-trans-nonaprenyl-diphosphate synthase